MGRTIAEKIFSNHANRDLRAHEVAICNVDFCFGQDSTSSLIIESFGKLGVASVFDRTKVAMIIDHSSPSPSIAVSQVHKAMREFALEKQVKLFEIGEGVCHQLIPERGLVTAGDLVLGADSHTSTCGAINALGMGVGSTDLAVTAAGGKNWFKVPESIKIVINGKPEPGVYSKDIMLHIIKSIGITGAIYKAIEYHGKFINDLSIDGRFTVANMSVEMGAKTGIMNADKKTIKWLKEHSTRIPVPVNADPDAQYAAVKEFDVSKLSPQIAAAHSVDNLVPIEQTIDVRIDQGFIGSCSNGRLEDLEVAAKILKGNKVHPEVKLIIAPVSKGVFLEAVRRGIIEVFMKAGAVIVGPGCGPCVGTHNGVPADGENVISTSNMNYKGRMGNPKANIYLGSPATVAASCIEAKIVDPRKYKKRLK